MSSEPPPPPTGDVSSADTPSQPQTIETTQSTDTDSQTSAAPPASKQPAATAQPPAQIGDVTMAEDIRAEVEREQALADLQRKVGGLEEELSKCREELRRLEGEKDGAVSTTNQLRTQLSSLQSSHHKTTSELSVLQTRIEAIEGEKRELLEEMERLQQRTTRGAQLVLAAAAIDVDEGLVADPESEELHTLRSQKAEASQKIAHLDVEVSELRMAADSAKFNEERSTQALAGARAEVLRLGQAVAEVEERFGRYRAEKQTELSSIQVEHDNLVARLTSAESSYHALQRSYNEQSRRLAEAHANIANLTSAAASKKASTSIELHRLMEENRVLEKRAEDSRVTISDREAELERLVGAHEDEKAEWQDRCKAEERRRKEAEKRSEDLSVVVERLALAAGEGTDVSPALALATEMKQSGKSYTQFYADYTRLEAELRTAQNEVGRLTQLLDEVSQDIAEKKPLLDEQASEHAAAIERANALAAELATVIASRDALEDQVKSFTADAAHHSDEVASLRSTADDLARQVQGLLRQVAILNDPSLASSNIAENTSIPETGDIITDHLVEFKSIRALQDQNQKLLKLTRGLMAKLDAREISRATAEEEDIDTGASLDQATETIVKLHTQLLEAQKKINEASRERDFFSKLLARGEGLKWSNAASLHAGNGAAGKGPLEEDGEEPHRQTIEALRAEIDVVRIKAEEEVRVARDEVRVKTEAVGSAEVGRARAEAKATMLEEQARTLNETNMLQKQQFDGLEAQYRQLQASIAQAQAERRSALEQVASRQGEADRLRTEAANLRAEKEQWKSTESRLQADFRSVQTERTRLQQLIDNLNSVSAENERSRVEERMRLEKRIEELSRETTVLRGQIEQAKDATRAAEKRAEDFDARLDSATIAVRTEKEAAEKLAASRDEQIKTLQSELDKVREESEKRKNIGLNWKRRADTLQASQGGHSEAIAAKDKEIEELKARITGLEKELEEVRGKLGETEKKLEGSQRAEALKEGTVQRLQSELAAARAQGGQAAQTAGPGPDAAALAAIESQRDGLQQKVAELEKQLEAAKAAQPVPPAEGAPAGTGEKEIELQARLEALQKEKDDLDKRYEDNVTKVNRVNASLRNRLTDLTTATGTSESRIAELEKQLAEAQAAQAAAATGSEAGAAGEAPSQAAIDEKVRAAVAARETELAAAHAKELDAVRSQPAPATGEQPAVDVQQAVQAKESELNASFENRLSTAIATQKAELETAQGQLKTQMEELQQKIKTLERQLKTAEISRKTLERQKTEAENKAKRLEAGSPAPAPTPTHAQAQPQVQAGGLSPAAAEFKPVPSTAAATTTGTAPAAPVSTTPAQAAAPAAGTTPARGAARGRARGTAVRGARGGAAGGRPSVLDAVNATLAQTTPSPATTGVTSPTGGGGTKRPLPEDGEITDSGASSAGGASTTAGAAGGAGDILTRIQGAAAGGGERGRVLKRPRGAAAGRGARGGAAGAAGARRASGQGQGQAQGGETGGGGAAGSGGGAGGAAPGGGEGSA